MDKKTLRKIQKKWQRSTSIEGRLEIVAMWLQENMNDIAAVTSKSAVSVLMGSDIDSRSFCDKPVTVNEDPIIYWSLADNWYRCLMVQALHNTSAPVKQLFDALGWNYEESLSPKYGVSSTVEEFTINDVINGASTVNLQLIDRSLAPVGSVWVSKAGRGAEYTVIGRNESGRCELEGANGLLERHEWDLHKNWEKLAQQESLL